MASAPSQNDLGDITTATQKFLAQLDTLDKVALSRLAIGYRATAKDLKGRVDALAAEIAQLQAAGKPVTIGKVYQLERAQALLAQADAAFAGLAKITGQYMPEDLHAAALAAGQASVEMVGAAMGDGPGGLTGSWATMPHEQIRQLAGQLAEASPLRELLDGFGEEASQHFRSELGRAVAQGFAASEIAKVLHNATNVPLARAGLIARTEIMRAAREGQRLTWQQNKHLVKAWVWVAGTHGTGRHRTCAACWAMNGTKHPLDEPMGSHPGCRCTQVPETVSWEDLGYPKGTGHEPPRIPTGQELFAQLPELKQRRILGPGRYHLYKSGVPLKHMVAVRRSKAWGVTRSVKSVKAIKAAKAQADANKKTPPQREAEAKAKKIAEQKAKKAAYDKAWKAKKKAEQLAAKQAQQKADEQAKQAADAKAKAAQQAADEAAKKLAETKAKKAAYDKAWKAKKKAEKLAAAKQAAPTPPPAIQPAKVTPPVKPTFKPAFDDKARLKGQRWFKQKDNVSDMQARANAKQRIQHELGKRLAADPGARVAWQRYNASRHPADRVPVPTTDTEWARTMGGEVDHLVRRWAGTSGDSDHLAIASQLAVKHEFGLDTASVWWDPVLVREAEQKYREMMPLLRRFHRAQYEWTQEELTAVGITEVSLVRGVHLNDGMYEWQARVRYSGDSETVDVDLQPASSFTTNVKTAEQFAGGSYRGWLYRVTIPRELILGTARTGYGCLNEYEWVILGGEGEYLVEKP